MEFSVYGNKYARTLATTSSKLSHLHCYRQVTPIFTFISDYSVKSTNIEMPSLMRKEKVTCEICGTQTTGNNFVWHKKSCSAGTLYWTQCPKFSTKSQDDLNYHIAKSTAPRNLMSTSSVNFVIKRFQDFTLYVNRSTQHAMQVRSRTRNVNLEHAVGDVEDHRLREELRSCQNFLVDSELESVRHEVFNYAVETLNETIMNEKLDHFFNNLKCAPKVNLAFGFILKNIEDWGFRYFLRTREQYPAGSIQTCLHPWRLREVERFSQQIRLHRVL